MFQAQTITCPACGTEMAADLFYSVNADRRPDLREGVIDGSFQRFACTNCAASFRIDPEFNYLDLGRGQWISVHAFSKQGLWQAIEATDQESFDKAYGPGASAGARAIGAGLAVRIVFGWPAFREKIVAAQSGLDDRELELLKMALLRLRDGSPLSQNVELRFVERSADGLILSWIDATTDVPVQTLMVPPRAYDEIAQNLDDWAELRADMARGPFVDMQRLLM